MRLSNSFGVLKRRWYLALLGLVLTAVGCLLVLSQIPASYEAKGSLVLMPPSATVGEEGNPYLFLGGMEQALDVLARQVSSEEITEPVLDGHPDTEYTIGPDRSTSGPILKVEAVGATPQATMDVLYAALRTVPVALDSMQDELSIEEPLRIGLMTVVVDTEPTKDDNQRVQLTIFAAAMGLAGTALVTGLVDGYLLSARRRQDEERETVSTHPPRTTAGDGVAARPRTHEYSAAEGDGLGSFRHGGLGDRRDSLATREAENSETDDDPVPRVGATRP